MSGVQCPVCGEIVPALQSLDADFYEQLQRAGQKNLPVEMCPSCIQKLQPQKSRTSILVAQEKAREHRKLMIWKTRVSYVKQARTFMTQKAYSDAAVNYEKYLRALEIVFDVKPGELTPEKFKESARTRELTVVSSVYWDLMRIYDTSAQYGERMTTASKKLSQFLRLTPIYPDVIRKAENFAKTAKNPNVVKAFLKVSSESKGRCFIATAAFEDPFAKEVSTLQLFREQCLQPSRLGRFMIRSYYRTSPAIAIALERTPLGRRCVRFVLRLFIRGFHLKGPNGSAEI